MGSQSNYAKENEGMHINIVYIKVHLSVFLVHNYDFIITEQSYQSYHSYIVMEKSTRVSKKDISSHQNLLVE